MLRQRRRISGPFVSLVLTLVAVVVCGYTLIRLHRIGLADALCDAAKSGDVVLIKALLKQGADPNELNAMDYAKQGGHREAIQLLEQAGAKEKTSKWTP